MVLLISELRENGYHEGAQCISLAFLLKDEQACLILTPTACFGKLGDGRLRRKTRTESDEDGVGGGDSGRTHLGFFRYRCRPAAVAQGYSDTCSLTSRCLIIFFFTGRFCLVLFCG